MNENKQMGVTVKGIYPEYDVIENPEIKYGRSINKVDIYDSRKVCIIGSRIVEELYVGDENPCGKFIQVDGVFYKIVGVSGKGSEGMSINGNPATSVIIPFTTLQKAYNRGKRIDLLCFTARQGHNISEVQDKVEQILKHAHSISPTDTQAVMKVNAEAIFGMIDSLFAGVSILVWLIGLGTLFSGAIGVSNIMVVTVKERTTEIGIRRAIGATPTDILTQIMSESIVLTLVAGLSGITFAVICLQGLENVAQQTSPDASFQISFGIAVGAAAMLAALGVVAGLPPAFRAMSIKPVDAMREE
jgi:putative ABC transport system permease protein